jgi:hypothetical protein
MKKFAIMSILVLGIFSFLSAQNVSKYEFCQANVSTGYFNSIVQLDSETAIPFKLNWNKYIIDENGKYLKVKSVAEFINIMSQFGWEFVDFFQASSDNSSINILFKKELRAALQAPETNTGSRNGG